MTDGDDTRERLKQAALALFSERGIDGVSVRDIVKKAGARNSASVHYYFRTKDDLVKELVIEAARRSDRARNAALDQLEASGKTIGTADIVRLIVNVETVGTGDPEQVTAPAIGFNHMRFVAAMQQGHRASFMEAIENRWNSSYMRCIDHIRANLTHLPASVVSQRLMLMFVSLTSVLAAREAAVLADNRHVTLWTHPELLENFVGMLAAGLEGDFVPSAV